MPTNNNINTGKPIEVTKGGTQNSSFTPYGVICGGATATGALQNVGAGSAKQVLISQGNSALPVWGGGPGDLILLQTQSANNQYYVTFTGLISPTYNNYMVLVCNLFKGSPDTSGRPFCMQFSTDNGASWVSSGYQNASRGASSNVDTSNNPSWSGYPFGSSTSQANISASQLFGQATGASFVLNLYNLTSGGVPSYALGNANLLGGWESCASRYGSNLTVNAIRFFWLGAPGVNPIQYGTFSLYGLT